MIAPEIRKGKVSDASALAELAARTFYGVHAPLTSAKECRDYVDAAFTKRSQAAELADPKSAFFTAWVGKTMAGYAKLTEKNPPCPVGDKPVALQRIYLDDKWLGGGIGARLMEACVEEAAGRGFQTLWLQVHDKNDRAIEFYKKWGFAIVAPCTFAMGERINCNYLMAASMEGPMSPRTKFLSKLVGLTCILLSLTMAAHRQAAVATVTALIGDPPAMFILGMILAVAGLAMVLSHNVWSGGARAMIVTAIGWLTLAKGTLFLLFPPQPAAAFFLEGIHYSYGDFFYLYMAVLAALGAYLAYGGFDVTPLN